MEANPIRKSVLFGFIATYSVYLYSLTGMVLFRSIGRFFTITSITTLIYYTAKEYKLLKKDPKFSVLTVYFMIFVTIYNIIGIIIF